MNAYSSLSLIFSNFTPLERSELSAPGRLSFLVSYNDTLYPTSFQEELHEVRDSPQASALYGSRDKVDPVSIGPEALDDQLISQGAQLAQRWQKILENSGGLCCESLICVYPRPPLVPEISWCH